MRSPVLDGDQELSPRDARDVWIEHICNEGNNHVTVGSENYFISADGYLMPTRKDQPPPDGRYFKPTAR